MKLEVLESLMTKGLLGLSAATQFTSTGAQLCGRLDYSFIVKLL